MENSLKWSASLVLNARKLIMFEELNNPQLVHDYDRKFDNNLYIFFFAPEQIKILATDV